MMNIVNRLKIAPRNNSLFVTSQQLGKYNITLLVSITSDILPINSILQLSFWPRTTSWIHLGKQHLFCIIHISHQLLKRKWYTVAVGIWEEVKKKTNKNTVHFGSYSPLSRVEWNGYDSHTVLGRESWRSPRGWNSKSRRKEAGFVLLCHVQRTLQRSIRSRHKSPPWVRSEEIINFHSAGRK